MGNIYTIERATGPFWHGGSNNILECYRNAEVMTNCDSFSIFFVVVGEGRWICVGPMVKMNCRKFNRPNELENNVCLLGHCSGILGGVPLKLRCLLDFVHTLVAWKDSGSVDYAEIFLQSIICESVRWFRTWRSMSPVFHILLDSMIQIVLGKFMLISFIELE